VGVKARTPDGALDVFADLVVGADGRHSIVRERAGLVVKSFGAPIDVLWMRLPRRADDPSQVLGYVEAGHVFVMLDRGDYWQCAYVIQKDGFAEIRQRGLDDFRRSIAAVAPFLADRVNALRGWDDVKLLTVAVDRLERWYRPGLLCIGDAAHAMSPIGGVGINLAIQDAVATSNLLTRYLARGTCNEGHLARVQARREFPTRVIQRFQVIAQERVLKRTLEGRALQKVPLVLKLLRWWPLLRRIPARLVGIGVRPEHVVE
jgi:2-polyprenyl-6-methoxyphenol hydroxylase-like FAD-dependent oxidoreductase